MSPRTPTLPTMRTCLHCGATFGPSKGRGLYCSHYHRTAAWRQRAGRKGGINKKTGLPQ